MQAPVSQRFSFPAVVDAAMVPYETAKKWVPRGHLVMSDADREEFGRGGRRMLSFHTAMQLIVGAELFRLGIAASDALSAARAYSHVGQDGRNPGELYRGAATVLAWSAGNPPLARVLPVRRTDNFIDVFKRTSPRGLAMSAAFVDVGELLLSRASLLHMSEKWIRDAISEED